MTLLQQLDSIFSVANGLLFVLVALIAVCFHIVIVELLNKRTNVELANEDDLWHLEEANAHYDGAVVRANGRCGCNKEFHFTTTSEAAKDGFWCDMIACNHCPVCNPDLDKMLCEPVAKELHELTVIV